MSNKVRRYIHVKPQKFKVVGFVGYNPKPTKESLNLTLNVSANKSLDVSYFLNDMIQAVV